MFGGMVTIVFVGICEAMAREYIGLVADRGDEAVDSSLIPSDWLRWSAIIVVEYRCFIEDGRVETVPVDGHLSPSTSDLLSIESNWCSFEVSLTD